MSRDNNIGNASPSHDSPGVAKEPEFSDRELVCASLSGDERAFSQIYRRYAPTVGPWLRRVVGNDAEVADLLQKTFLEVFRSLPRFQPDRRLQPWINGIAANVLRGHLRYRRMRHWLGTAPQPTLESVPTAPHHSPEERAMQQQLAHQLYTAMNSLPAHQRICFALVEIHEMGLREVGELVGASAQTVWARAQTARKKLTRLLANPSHPHNAEVQDEGHHDR